MDMVTMVLSKVPARQPPVCMTSLDYPEQKLMNFSRSRGSRHVNQDIKGKV
jgi:hypothetical protein